jgi:GcrA cell cycle regulator
MARRSNRKQILELADGKRTSSEIAAIVGCTRTTVNEHVASVPDAFVKPTPQSTRAYSPHGASWTEERAETLKKLWAEGLSASQIAMKLGGVSRNAVIGKISRMGLPGRTTTKRTPKGGCRVLGKPVRRAPNPLYARKPKPPEQKVVSFTPTELVIPEAERKSFAGLEAHHCRWPIGDPQAEDFHFCGRQKSHGSSYCEHHTRVATGAPTPQKKKQKPYTIPDNRKQFEVA